MNFSFWEHQNIEYPCDITIIGAGIVGLSTAISLKESNPDWSIKILERGANPYGASTKNAGFACFGSVSELMEDIKLNGIDQCKGLLRMRWQGLEILKKRVPHDVMHYRNCGGTEYFKPSDDALATSCMDQIDYYNELIANTLELNNCYSIEKQSLFGKFSRKCIVNQCEGVLNPVLMMKKLALTALNLGVHLHYGIDIASINIQDNALIYQDHRTIHYHKLIVCTNGFAANLLPNLNVKPARNQVLITQPQSHIKLDSAYHLDQGYIYFRQIDSRILLGGGRNIDPVGETTDHFGHSDQIQEYLMGFLEQYLDVSRTAVDYWWSGILGIGDSKFPIVEFIGDDVLVGVRMGGMGVAIGSYIGEQLASEMTTNIGAR